ncbi:MAG: serine hydrolase [Candidatus Acidiferrales bacterium]
MTKFYAFLCLILGCAATLILPGLTAEVATTTGFPPIASNAQTEFAGARKFVGRWTGIIDETRGAFHTETFVDFEIRFARTGGLEFVDHDREPMTGAAAPVVRTGRDTIQITWKRIFPNPIKAVGTLRDGGEVLEMQVSGAEMTGEGNESVRLRRNDPHAIAFTMPRISRDGTRDRNYAYKAPDQLSDGWPVSTLEHEQIDRATVEEAVKQILAQSGDPASNTTDSVLIARHGRLVFEEYFWGYKRGTAHGISSCTKSLTSILAGIASDRGNLRMTGLVSQYFQNYPDTRWIRERYPITIDEMLAMDAGIAWNEGAPYSDPKNTTQPLLEAKDPIRFMLDQPLTDPPGTKYNYDSGLPTMMGTLLTLAVGEPIEKFADQELFEPLGIRNYEWARQNDGSVLAAGGFFMAPRDLLKLGQLMLNRGTWRGKRILSEDWVQRSTSQHTPAQDYAYGYYWHLINSRQWSLGGHNGYMGIGQGGQYITVLPDLNIVIAITSANWEPGGSRLPFELIQKYIVPAAKQSTASAARQDSPRF